jgi:hypothetical protein
MATTPKDTSLSSAFRYAIDQPLENMATTFQALGMEGWEKFMRDLVEEPENYEVAAERFINAQGEGFNWEYFPRAVFEQAGQIAGSLATRAGGAAIGAGVSGPAGMAIGALLGPGLFEAVQIAGPVALERAKNEGREEPNWEDWTGALGTATASGVLNAVGIKNVGVLNSTIKQVGKATAAEGLTEGAQGAIEQIGGTALTEAGLQIDPKAAVGEGLLGAGAGGGTQIGTQAVGQIAPPVQDGTLGANLFTKFFGKKKDTQEVVEEAVEEAPFVMSQDEERQARIEQAQINARETAESLYPNLIKAYEPSEIDFLEIGATQMSNGNVDAQSFDEIFPKILSTAEQFGIKEEDVVPFVKRIMNKVSTDDAYLITPDYTDDERLVRLDEYAILDFVAESAKGYYDEVKSSRPEMYLNEPKIKGKDIYNKPPLLKIEGISQDIQQFDPDFPRGAVPPLGMVKPRFSEEQSDILFNSKQGMVEPTLFSYSKFLSPENPLLANFPKKGVPADEALKLLNIELAPGEGKKSHGMFKPAKNKNSLFATRAIEGKIADFLLNKGKETVTKQDIIDRYVNHLSAFNGILLSDAGRTVDRDDYTSFAIPNLDERFDRDTYFGNRYFEIVKEELENVGAPKILIDTLEDSNDVETRILGFPAQQDMEMQNKLDAAKEKADERMAGIVSLNSMFFPSVESEGRPIEPYIPKHGASMQTFSAFQGNGTPELRRLGEDIEVILNYDAELDPEGEARLSQLPPDINLTAPMNEQLRRIALYQEEIKRRDPDYYTYRDSTHHWTGDGTLAWMRGGMFSHGPDGKYKNTKGVNMTEVQSGAHGWVQSTRPSYSDFVYKSKAGGTKLTRKEFDRLENGYMFDRAIDQLQAVAFPSAPGVALFSLLPDFNRNVFLKPSAVRDLNVGPSAYVSVLKEILPSNIYTNLKNSGALRENMKKASDMYADYGRSIAEAEFINPQTPALGTPTIGGLLRQTLGIIPTKEQIDTLTEDWIGDGNFTYKPGSLLKLGLISRDAIGDPEIGDLGQRIQKRLNKIEDVAADWNKKEVAALYKPYFEEALVHSPALFELYKRASDEGNLPNLNEFSDLKLMESQATATGRGVTPDMPLKKDWPRAMVQLTIVKSLMHDPNVTHLYLPTASAGGGPTSPYMDAIREAEQISEQFDLDFKKIFDFEGQVRDPETGQTVEKPVDVFALEIAPLREMLIEGGGFEGKMQKGGLVKGSSPVYEVLNLGDYGQKFI